MATLHFHQITTLTPEQYIAGLTDFWAWALETLWE